jgi:hypothetical protein
VWIKGIGRLGALAGWDIGGFGHWRVEGIGGLGTLPGWGHCRVGGIGGLGTLPGWGHCRVGDIAGLGTGAHLPQQLPGVAVANTEELAHQPGFEFRV